MSGIERVYKGFLWFSFLLRLKSVSQDSSMSVISWFQVAQLFFMVVRLLVVVVLINRRLVTLSSTLLE